MIVTSMLTKSDYLFKTFIKQLLKVSLLLEVDKVPASNEYQSLWILGDWLAIVSLFLESL